jgi:hypothetical protein
VTLNKDCTYKSFCPPEKTDSRGNPRLAVLENFKEISRIMTNNFISHKKLEQRYHGALPKTEYKRVQIEEEAASRMVNILKLMHSPNNFNGPLTLLPF